MLPDPIKLVVEMVFLPPPVVRENFPADLVVWPCETEYSPRLFLWAGGSGRDLLVLFSH